MFNNKLLVGSFQRPNLIFIYSLYGTLLSTLEVYENDEFTDATLTLAGIVMYTTNDYYVVSINRPIGRFTRSNIPGAQHLAASYDGMVYLIASDRNVHESTNEGMTWNFVFQSISNWKLSQVLKVFVGKNENFWALQKSSGGNTKVFIHKSNEWNALAPVNGVSLDFSGTSMAYDGKTNIFFCDNRNKVVHVFSALNQTYIGRLLSPKDIDDKAIGLAAHVDLNGKLLLTAAFSKGTLKVFEIEST